jgi:hypothetical protein
VLDEGAADTRLDVGTTNTGLKVVSNADIGLDIGASAKRLEVVWKAEDVPNTVPIVFMDKRSVDVVGADSATMLVGIAKAIDVWGAELPVWGKPTLGIVWDWEKLREIDGSGTHKFRMEKQLPQISANLGRLQASPVAKIMQSVTKSCSSQMPLSSLARQRPIIWEQ